MLALEVLQAYRGPCEEQKISLSPSFRNLNILLPVFLELERDALLQDLDTTFCTTMDLLYEYRNLIYLRR